jgi:hypothetical protein
MPRSDQLGVDDLCCSSLMKAGIIERRFGDLKNHFQILHSGFDFHPSHFQTVFRMCIALHNLIADPALYTLLAAPETFSNDADDSDMSVGAVYTVDQPAAGTPSLQLQLTHLRFTCRETSGSPGTCFGDSSSTCCSAAC